MSKSKSTIFLQTMGWRSKEKSWQVTGWKNLESNASGYKFSENIRFATFEAHKEFVHSFLERAKNRILRNWDFDDEKWLSKQKATFFYFTDSKIS